MGYFLDYSYFVLLGILVVLAVIDMRTMKKFLKSLEQNENDTWRELGSPSLTNNSPQVSMTVLRFILSNQFQASDHAETVELGSKVRKQFVVYMIVFGLTLAAFATSLVAT